ncbi:hypothetical protein GF406_26320 [candidate division KSB1 bacterium]|nr:hypothetical protein [candidate division KSB1 bacterium]
MRYVLALILLCTIHIPMSHSQPVERLNERMVRGYLENGLEYVLIPKEGAPVVAAIVTVKAGSRFESAETSGASHYLEHLLFNGTETRTQEELYETMDRIGGYNNASTSEDYVSFMVLAAKTHIDTAMAIQADMLFNSTLPPEKFEKEKGIIAEEIAQSMSRPGYQNQLLAQQLLYDQSPYARPVLGTPLSIRSMRREQVWDFYQRFYAPNNMILMIVGDLTGDEMIEKAQKWYEPYPAKPIDPPKVDQPSFSDHKPFHVIESNVRQPSLDLIWKGPDTTHPLFFAFELLPSLLNEGQMQLQNRLDQRVIKSSTYFQPHPQFSVFNVSLSLQQSSEPQALVEQIKVTFAELAQEEWTPQLLDAARLSVLTENEINAERPHFYGMLKSQWLVLGGSPWVAGYQDSLRSVTIDEIKSALNWLATHPHKAVLITSAPEKSTLTDQTGEVMLDETLENGLRLIVSQQNGSDILALHALAKHRSAMEPDTLPGVTVLLHDMLLKGTEKYDEQALTRELRKIGAQVKVNDLAFIPFDDYYTDHRFSFVRFESLNHYKDQAIDLFGDLLSHPRFDSTSLQAIVQQKMGMARRPVSASDRAKTLFWQETAPNSPFVKPINAPATTLQQVDVETLRRYHARYFAPSNLIISAVSELPARQVMQLLKNEFKGLVDTETDIEIEPVRINQSQENMFVSDSIGSAQAAVLVGQVYKSVPMTDHAALYIANAILSSRVAFQLREKQGLAYRIGSFIEFVDDQAVIAVQMGTRAENIDSAQKGILAELQRLVQDLPDDQEVMTAINQAHGSRLMRQLLSMGRAYLMGLGAFLTDQPRYYQNFDQELMNLKPAQVRKAINTYMQKQHSVIVTVK